MSIFKIEQAIRRIELDILDKFYEGEEDITSEEEQIEYYKGQLATKLKGYIYFLKERVVAKAKERIDERIKELQSEKKHLDKVKHRIEASMNNFIINRPLEYPHGYIEVTEEGESKPVLYMRTDNSVRRTVDLDKVDRDKHGVFNITLTAKQFKLLKDKLVPQCNTIIEEEANLLDYVINADYKCNVTSLDENDPAIIKNIRPTVKITKSKPKV